MVQMTGIESNITHILFSAIPSWGHVRPFCILAARLVKEDQNMVVTMIISPTLLDKARKEVSAELRSEETESVCKRLRILSSFNPDKQAMPLSMIIPLAETYATSYQTLCASKAIACAVTGTKFEPVRPPNLVVLGFFALAQIHATRAVTGTSVPIAVWLTGHAAALIQWFGPANLGGYGGIADKIEEEARQKGISPEEIGNRDKVFNHTDGNVVKIPGLPDMYDWEFFPQKSTNPIPMAEIIIKTRACFKASDVVLITSMYAFEKESLEGMKSWFSDWNKDSFVIGPLLPSGYGTLADSPRGSNEIQEFLDKKQHEDGPKSVVLVSFGSMFWPSPPEYLEEVIEALIEKKIPFILSTASPLAKLSDVLIGKIKMSGLGIISAWCPQQYILNHPATGWFLTHCGHNSVTEAIGSGIPMICWPFEADQPAAAVHLSDNLNLAFELIEVRTGENALKPIYRNGRAAKGTREAVGVEIREILDACRGAKGEKMRENVQIMKSKFAEAWEEEGISRKEWNDFLKKYIN